MNNIVLLFVFGLVLVIYMLPAWAAIYIEEKDRKKRGEPPKEKALYDERQRTLRLQASQCALLSLAGVLLTWAVLHLGGWFAWTNAIVEIVFCALLFALTVWRVYCVLHDAEIGWNQKPETARGQMIIHICVGFSFSVQGWSQEGAFAFVFLFGALCMWATAAAMICANRRRKKAEKYAVEEE